MILISCFGYQLCGVALRNKKVLLKVAQSPFHMFFFFYLQIAVDCIHISLHVFVPRLRPVRIDSNGDEATLCCSVLVIVEVPGLSVGLDQVVSCDIMLSRDA